MAWTEEQISTYQIHNEKFLGEINSTLLGLTGKPIVGIFCPGQNGDSMTASSVLKYKEELWPNKDIVWFCNMPVADFLKYSKEVNQVRPWPWANNGLPYGTPDFWPLLMNENNQLNLELASQYELTKDLSSGYFPAPYMLEPQKRHGLDYPNCSRKVFGIPTEYEWHPVIEFSDEEKEVINKWFPPYHAIYSKTNPTELIKKKCIAIETFCGSGQSLMNDTMIRDAMKLCKQILGECYFIFVSHKYLRTDENFPEDFGNDKDIYFASQFTVRQCGYIVSLCELLISVSSGVTVAASCWANTNLPIPTFKDIIQYCGSWVCSTVSLSKGRRFELITADNKIVQTVQTEFMLRLESLLKSI